MKSWSIYVLVITLYTILFENERNDKNIHEGDEIDSFKELVNVIVHMVKRPNFVMLLKYLFLHEVGIFVSKYVAKIYLIDDLKYP